MKKVLIADNLPDVCVDMLTEAGLEVENRPGLPPEELGKAAAGAHGIICRSGARITADVLSGALKLEAICRAGVGVSNIDVGAASRKGVVVMNTPGGNTISTAEHAFALMLALARNIGPAYIAMRGARWDKKKFMGSQLSSRTLGIIGLGRIGQTVARRGQAFGMNVLGYDPYVGRDVAEKLGIELVDGLRELLAASDYITVHVPQTAETRGLINADNIGDVKRGACIINCARGPVVDQDAVVAAVEDGRLGGAAFDVYDKEPPADYGFAQNDRVLATPHLGASTEQAQLAVATEAAEQMIAALQRGHYRNALNVTSVSPKEMERIWPYCQLAAHIGQILARVSSGRPESLEIICAGELAEGDVEPIVRHGIMGVLRVMVGDVVNMVSAPLLAEERGIPVKSSTMARQEVGFTDLIEIRLATEQGTVEAVGTMFGRRHARLVRLAGFHIELVAEGHLLFVFCKDRPGAIGKVGDALGDRGINVARMAFGRQEAGGKALLAVNLDSPCDEQTAACIAELDVVDNVVAVEI